MLFRGGYDGNQIGMRRERFFTFSRNFEARVGKYVMIEWRGRNLNMPEI